VFCQSTEKTIDSLKNALKTTQKAGEEMSLFNELTKAYIYKDTNVFMQYNDSLLYLSKQLNDKDMVMTATYNYAVGYRMQGDYEKAIQLQKEYIPYILEKADTLKIAMSYYQLGANYVRLDKIEDAITNLTIALSYSDAIYNKSLSSKILNAQAVIFKNMGQLEKAKSTYNSAIEINKKLKDTNALAIIYNGKGIIYMHQDSTLKALNVFKKSLEYAKIVENTALLSYQYRNIGTVFQKNKNYRDAEEYYLKALEIRKIVNQKISIGGSLNDLGEVYLETNQLNKSEKYFLEALDVFTQLKTVTSQNYINSNLSELYTKKRNFEKANYYLKRYHAINDSINNNELREKVNDIEIKYKTEKKDKEITQQQLALNEQTLKLQKKQSQYKLMTGFAIFLLISGMLSWFIYQQRQKRKNQEIVSLKREQQVKTLELLMEGEEKERFRIAKELHDGVNVDLSAIKYKLTSLLEKNNQVINEAVAMIDKSCEQVRAISHNLVPPALKDFTLIEALQDYCSTTNAIHQTKKVSFQNIGTPITLTKKAEANIFRIVQELVNNSIKHAEASEIDVQISYQNNTIQLTIEDNGKGFNIKNQKGNGIGLQNVNSRITYLNAKLDVTSDATGTSYVIDINANI